LLAIVMVLRQQSSVALKLRGCTDDDCAGSSWLMDLFASVWHLLAIGYLIAVFLLGSARLIIYGPQMEIPFIISLLIVPIYLTLDSAANWVINALIGTVRSQDGGEDISSASKLALTGTAQETSMRRTMRRIFRAAIVFTLIIWLLNIWGFEVPFAKPLAEAAFEIFITLVLSYMIWRMINGFISRKLAEAQPEADQKEEEDEWGGAATQDRSYTLLPIVRKFIATVMVVMVTLIVLSSLGVNIGPLLAGAGVAGLAIGFGAQKLVADVLSGIFYLVDDAFRVGEYIQAGSVSGAVEAITLRNVMLRHHRGMLQIVPFSDLGPVTNFMRGGIVVKFNLQFPYDTDINKVRKIIKKVGKKMLEDPEFGANFIKPVKSQGVREVGDSVMTIRVKFTAKPGTHFVIRREAYRRITEALEAKGIHYAHRRVIVEVAQPEADQSGENTKQGDNPTADASRTPIDDPKVSRAAAAAAERMVRNHRIKPDSDF
jgi:small-conductance mechanosensitive channel